MKRGEKISGVAPSYDHPHVGPFLPVTHEDSVGKKAPVFTLSQLKLLITAVLPMKTFDIATLIELVKWTQLKNHRASLLSQH